MNDPKTDVKQNTAMVKRTERALQDYPEGKFNRLLPTTTLLDNLGNFQEPKIEILQFNADPDGGDVYIDYRLGKGKRLFTKNALDKIAYAGGLSWYAPFCTTEERAANRRYVRCKATAVIKKANGEPLMITRTKEIDLDVEEEKIRENYRRKVEDAKVKQNEVEALVRRDLLQLRENMLQLCESKACNRVIRAAFGLKSSYAAAEIEKPFVMVRFDTAYDLNDPRMLKLLASNAQAMGSMLFPGAEGPTPQQLAVPAQAETGDDITSILDDDPDDEDEEVLSSEQQRILAREQRITELMAGCTAQELRDIAEKKFKEANYDLEGDPDGHVKKWKEGNKKGTSDEDKKRVRAEIIADLELAAGGDES
jgi:hypothetical protein